jgi:hypothetical protein
MPCNKPRRRGTQDTGGWVGLGAGLDRCGKFCPAPEIDPRTIQPAASRYTGYVIPTHQPNLYVLNSLEPVVN